MNEAAEIPTPYQRLGGAETLRRLVARFYELMDTQPAAQGIRAMHPASLAGSTEKLFMYLSGWLGGPPLYTDKFGHPQMRARHMPFSIGDAEVSQWMQCMRQAMAEHVEDATLREELDAKLSKLAAFMRNQGPN